MKVTKNKPSQTIDKPFSRNILFNFRSQSGGPAMSEAGGL
jgi:hypothetical protein